MNRLLVLVGWVVLVGCVGGSSFTAAVISTINTVGTGEQRVLVELRNDDGELLALDTPPNATLRDENGSPLGVYSGELVWVVPEEQPAYAFVVDIPEPATYQLTVNGGELGQTPPAGLVAVAETIQVPAGTKAFPIGGETVVGPLLVVFASPARCQSRSCQPMIDQVGRVANESGLEWQQVEVFANPEVSDDEDLELSAEVEEWGIPSQPWLYVIDDQGTVAALFEGAVSSGELARAVELVAS